MSAKIVRKVIDKIYANYKLVKKTRLEKDVCYYRHSFVEHKVGRHDPHIQIKDCDTGLLEMIYVPNSKERYYMNYDKINDSVLFYYCSKDYGSVFFSEPKNLVPLKNVSKLCTEEGHFQQMTVQDCSTINCEDASKILEIVNDLISRTEGYRNGTVKN
jgi:hypothetical protein